MRLIKIENCSYEKFEGIRDAIYETIPFAVFHVGYSKKLKLAIFNFWDSDYIPDEMQDLVLRPPIDRENRALLKKELAKLV